MLWTKKGWVKAARYESRPYQHTRPEHPQASTAPDTGAMKGGYIQSTSEVLLEPR